VKKLKFIIKNIFNLSIDRLEIFFISDQKDIRNLDRLYSIIVFIKLSKLFGYITIIS